MFLGINTACEPYSLGLVSDGVLLAEVTVTSRYSFLENLTDQLEQLLCLADKDLSCLKGVGVTVGPGNYTGIRIGVTFAKTLAQTLNLPAYAIPTLTGLAEDYAALSGLLTVIIPGRTNEYISALFALSNRQVKRLTQDFIWRKSAMSQAMQKIQGDIYVAGHLSAELQSFLKNYPNLHFLPRNLTGAVLAKQAEYRAWQGEQDDLEKIQPVYAYQPVIGSRVKATKQQ